MGNGNQHPRSNYWEVNSMERCMHCTRCGVTVDGLEWAADVFVQANIKSYIFYDFSSGKISTTISAGAKADGPTAGASVTLEPGTPMIKMLRREGHGSYMCVACFAKYEKSVFKSAVLSLKGLAAFINSDYTLNNAAYGDM